MDKKFAWNELKSQRLRMVRGAGFQEIISSKYIGIADHLKKQHQKVLLFEYRNYIWAVPCVENENEYFLKTLYPCRKYTKIFKKRGTI